MENIVANGVTTIDLSAENIVIEAGRSLKTGYLLHSAADWPSTADGGPQVDGKGGLISTDNGKTWYLSNDLGVNWVISIVLHEEVDVPVESVGFDEPEIELAVGDEMTLACKRPASRSRQPQSDLGEQRRGRRIGRCDPGN